MYQLAKRGKGRMNAHYTINDVYALYNKEHENDGFEIDEKMFKKVLRLVNQGIMKEVLEGNSVQFMCRIGRVRIQKHKMKFSKPRSLKIDWAKSRKLGKTIYHTNEHSKNYWYRILWDKKSCYVTNKTAYAFIPVRKYSRKLAEILKNPDNNTEYYE